MLLLIAIPTLPQIFLREGVTRAGTPALVTPSLTCLGEGRPLLNGSEQNGKVLIL